MYPFTSYVKLQQAYISESGTVFGNYTIIGYSTPGQNSKTTNFDFTEATRTWKENTATLSTTAATNAWQAKSLVKLNDCDAQSVWSISVAASTTNAGEATFTPVLPTDTDCAALTPSYKQIGK